VAAGAAIFSVGMLLSRILGMLRESLLNITFGNSDTIGAYKLAFLIPDLFYYLLAGGAMSAAFIPVFTSYLSRGEDKEAHLVGSTISTFLLIAMVICVGICIIFAPQILWLLPASHKFTPTAFNLCVLLSRIMCVMLIFTAQSAHLTGILNSYRHFLTPVIVWNVYALSSLFGITVMSKMPLFGGSPQNPSIYGVAYSIVLGAFLQAVIQFPVAIKHGFHFKLMLDFGHEGVRQILRLFGPMTISLSLSQINILAVPMLIGSSFGLLAVNDINNANKIVMLPFSLFAMAIGTAVFPTMAQQVAMGQHEAFRAMLSKAVKIVILLSMPSAICMLILADPLCALLYGGGKFTLQGVHASAYVLALFAMGVIGLGVAQVVNRAFYSLHDTITPTIVSVGMVLSNFICSWLIAFYTPFKYGSVALATTVTLTASTIVLIELLRRRLHGIDGKALLGVTSKSFIAALLMGIVIYLLASHFPSTVAGRRLLPEFHWSAPYLPFSSADVVEKVLRITLQQRVGMAIRICLSLFAGFVVYAGVLWAWKVEELKVIFDRFAGKLRKRQGA